MTNAPNLDLTGDEIATFTRKFEAFNSGLAPKERALMKEILTRAEATAGEEVSGYTQAYSAGPIGDYRPQQGLVVIAIIGVLIGYTKNP